MSSDPMATALVETAAAQDLAQANLLRVRGEFDQAEQRCLTILKRLPNDPGAHALLGDICADQGELERAAEWYELALDLSPNSPVLRQKLHDAQSRQEAKDDAETVEQLGLPEPSSSISWISGAIVLTVIVLAGLAILLGRARPNEPRPILTNVTAPANVARDSSPGPQNAAAEDLAKPADAPPAAASVAAMSQDDHTLMALLVSRSEQGAKVSEVAMDPRNRVATITYAVKEGEDARRVGAILARDVLTQSPDPLIVTLKGLNGDHLVYMADVTRLKYNETTNPAGKAADSNDPDAWISAVVQNEWPKTAPAATSGP